MKINIGQVKEPCKEPVGTQAERLKPGEVFSAVTDGTRHFYIRVAGESDAFAAHLGHGCVYRKASFNYPQIKDFLHHPHATLDGLCIKDV